MENTFTFPAVIGAGLYDTSDLWRVKMTAPRTTTYYELELPSEEGGILHIDGVNQPVSADFAVVVKPGTERRCTLPYSCMYVHIAASDCDVCRALDKLPTFVRPKDPESLRRIFSDLIDEAAKNPEPHGVARSPEGSGLMVYARLFELIAELERLTSKKPVSKKVDRSISRALEMIEERPGYMYTLQEFADELHLNPMYFGRLFQSVVGKSPFRYMMDKKITRAKTLLLTTDKTCGEIGAELGFSTQTHFLIAFRKATGMTPREFRRRW